MTNPVLGGHSPSSRYKDRAAACGPVDREDARCVLLGIRDIADHETGEHEKYGHRFGHEGPELPEEPAGEALSRDMPEKDRKCSHEARQVEIDRGFTIHSALPWAAQRR